MVGLKDFHPGKPGSITLPHIRELPSGASASVPWIMLKKMDSMVSKRIRKESMMEEKPSIRSCSDQTCY